MAKLAKRILMALILLVTVLAVVGLFLPTRYTVSRSIAIAADRERIHEHVGDLEKWDTWTPWREADPSLVIALGGQTRGVGASQSWSGRDSTGVLTLTMSSPQQGIEYDLFFDGGDFQSVATIRYESLGDGTTVTWTMDGRMDAPLIGGYLAAAMDVWAGPMLARGLEKLKAVAEGS